jgi:hypothetical protein
MRDGGGGGGEKKKSNDFGETQNDARRLRRLLVFWPHVSAGKFYFNRDGELKKCCFGEKKSRDDHGGDEKQRGSFSRLFSEYENALSKETRMGMLRCNFYEGEEKLSILSLFACARVCVSHANRIDWALDILTNFSAAKKNNNNNSAANEARKMVERAREILGGDEYFENDDDEEEEDEDEETMQMDPMELAMARMSGKSSSTTTKRRKRRGKEVSLRSRVQLMNEFDEYIARQKPNGYVDFMCYCSFCGYPDGIEQAIEYRNRAANINVPGSKKLFLHRGWRWLKRLDDIDRRFDFFTRDTRSTNTTTNKEEEEEIEETTLLFRIQLAKYVETVAILEGSARNNDGTNEDHELETMAAFRRNSKKNKNVRVNSLDTLLENTTYIILADNARRWSTYLYAYATPTVAALKAMNRTVDGKNIIKWLEIGAGKGIWCKAMRRFGIDVIATDSMPEAGNDYHLITASSNDDDDNIVEKMTHLEAIKKYSRRANGLFVCYPPPDSNMGSTSLKAFKGEYVAVIGEDLLNTGDIEMFAILNDQFKVSERVYLPQWMDTAHHLTIFKRRRESGERAKKVAKIEIKRRCRLCRWDRELFSTVEEHEQEHYLRFLPKVKTFSENELYETVAL